VRLPVVCSILAHAALVLAAMRLPTTALSRKPHVVTFDIREPTRPPPAPVEAPKPPPPVARPPEPRPRVEPLTPAQAHKLDKREQEQPPPVQPPPVQPTAPPSARSMRRGAPVGLALRGGGGGGVSPGPTHGGDGTGTLASAAPRKPWHPRGSAGDPILGKLADEKEERFPLKREDDGWHYDGPSFSAKIALDGTVDFDNHVIRDFKGLSGGFDVTDLIMKGRHQDPYRYEKEKFMETTAKLRGDLKHAARKARLESSLAALPSNLERVWGDGSRSPRERRSILYSMWREASGSDDEVGAAGRKARATIEAFIRERLPEGSSDAYTAEELRRYNARAGALKFQPYRTD
jgi:hypothetical protein